MRTQIYEHRSGLKVVPNDIVDDVKRVIWDINPELSKKTVANIKKEARERLEKEGWTGEYRLDATSRITISSYLRGIGLCFQTGNVGRIYADLLKLQTFYTKGNITAGIILIPQVKTAKELGSNMANYERLIRELPIFSQVITMPIVVIGFDGTEAE
ncbi:MAG: hypothetical protein HDT21_05995 [Ruminococcus sp.]|nr:hypothetical protein [Ruminococcus sp.]